MIWNRITSSALPLKRKLLYHNKWTPATELRDRRKGKIKTSVFYRGKEHEAYLSHVRVQITASRKDIYLVLVYGITEHPMMLATNKEIKSKEDVLRVARIYFSRWKIEEYFRCKKQMFQFENFRVRKLHAINALNFYITVHGFSGNGIHGTRIKCTQDSNYKNSKPCKGKGFLLLLPTSQRHLRYTLICKKRASGSGFERNVPNTGSFVLS